MMIFDLELARQLWLLIEHMIQSAGANFARDVLAMVVAGLILALLLDDPQR